MLLLSAAPVRAATFSANSTTTLTNAINSANGNSEADTINITGNFTLTTNALPQITSAITINGNGFTINGRAIIFANNQEFPQSRAVVVGSGGNLTLNNVTLTDFYNSGGGGAINVEAGSLTLNQVTVRDSRSNSSGGGITADGSASVTINRSAIHGNSSNVNGGGIFFSTGVTATINNSSIFNNQALRAGGILVNSTSATLSLNHVTVTGNTASGTFSEVGDGIFVNEGTLNLRNSIIYGNSNQNCQIGSSGAVSVNSSNIIGGGSSASCSASQSSANPLLSANPTGSPPYYTFREDSPARNAATCISSITTDQRGRARPQDSLCDIGAYEWYPPPPAPPPQEPSDSGAIYIPPAEIKATATPGISSCLTLPGIVTYNLTESTQCQRLDAVGIGNAEIAVSGFADAVNVWSWVLPGTKICFEAEGSAFKFIDTEPIPRVVYDLPATNENGLTCGIIDRPGNLILLPGARPPAAPTPTLEALSLQNCMARTTNILNFRASPGGAVIQAIPYNAILTAVARTADWFKVDFHGVKGWISADFVEPIGTCG
ncbi:MAG: SH3 domain-containing protein [Chloroflexi bacterium]|nr:SH3 domain-containing protein [Chloroflexota bacterium]